MKFSPEGDWFDIRRVPDIRLQIKTPFLNAGYEYLMDGEKLISIVYRIRISDQLKKVEPHFNLLQKLFWYAGLNMTNLVPCTLEQHLKEVVKQEPVNTVWKMRPEEQYNGQSYLQRHINDPNEVKRICESAVGTS